MNSTKITSILATLAAAFTLTFAVSANAQNLIQNPDFNSDESVDYGLAHYNIAYSPGGAGEYNASTPDVAGSSAFQGYSQTGNVTGLSGYPTGVTTAGTFTADSGDVTVPVGGFTSNTENVNISGSSTSVRMASKSGDIYSFYQDVTTVGNVPIVFLPYMTYTLSAYSTANSSGNGAFANTGVGFSAGSALTYAGIVNNPSFVSLSGAANPTTLTLHTVSITVLPTENADLIGQQIVANLLDEASITGGGRSAYFTDVTLTGTATPEPSTYALLFGGLGFVAWVARRRMASAI